jgi:hypothetical protein
MRVEEAGHVVPGLVTAVHVAHCGNLLEAGSTGVDNSGGTVGLPVQMVCEPATGGGREQQASDSAHAVGLVKWLAVPAWFRLLCQYHVILLTCGCSVPWVVDNGHAQTSQLVCASRTARCWDACCQLRQQNAPTPDGLSGGH